MIPESIAQLQLQLHEIGNTRPREKRLPDSVWQSAVELAALSRNVPKLAEGVEILLANCLAHGRRQFVEVAANFPDQCRHVLEMLGQVYGHDAEACERGLKPEERLQFHQERSGPVMEKLHGWLEAQFAERKTEPNSGLGKAITYSLRHWRSSRWDSPFSALGGIPLPRGRVRRSRWQTSVNSGRRMASGATPTRKPARASASSTIQ